MTSLAQTVRTIDALNEHIGRAISWLALCMVLVQFALVMMRYVFGLGSTIMQESVVYMHAIVFLVAAGYTLVHDGHVRVDIFYATASPRAKAIIDIIGVSVFLLPMCALIAWVGWPYVRASWAVLEISQEGRLGIPAVYLFKTLILVFAGLLALQGLALAARSMLVLKGVVMPNTWKDAEQELRS